MVIKIIKNATSVVYNNASSKLAALNVQDAIDGLVAKYSNVENTADSEKSVKYAQSAGSVAWGDISDKPSTYPPSSHNHNAIYYTKTEFDTKFANANEVTLNSTYGCVYKKVNGIVVLHIDFASKSIANGTVIGKLPSGFIPLYTMSQRNAFDNQNGEFVIEVNGQVLYQSNVGNATYGRATFCYIPK